MSVFSPDEWRVIGQAEGCRLGGDVLTVCDASVVYTPFRGENLCFTFSARAPEDAREADIWASVRCYNRGFRYMIGLRGGNHKHLYLSRLGAAGYDKMLALCPLDFNPAPGVWYRLKIVCAGERIAVYLNDEAAPRILCRDDDAPFCEGAVALGGSYIPTEYRDAAVEPVSLDALDGVTAMPDYLTLVTLPPARREETRRRDRARYRPYSVPRLPDERLTLSLDGDWLFVPDDEADGDASQPLYDDSRAHVIHVPEAWIPLQAWLEGEVFGPDQMNKGQSDNYWLEEFGRCFNYTFDWQATRSAWYRHVIELPDGIADKAVLVDFEGVALACEIYINGHKVRENIGMFTPMTVDLSGYVRPGRNVLALHVRRELSDDQIAGGEDMDAHYAIARDSGADSVYTDAVEHRPFNTDDLPHGFYTNHPGGIWRGVRLIIADRLRVEETWFRPTLRDAAITVTVRNDRPEASRAALWYELRHTVTGEYLCGGDAGLLTLDAGETREVSLRTPEVTPRLWEPGRPNLYRLTVSLRENDRIVDALAEDVGFRTVRFDGSTLLFNDRPLWVRGGNHMPAHVRPNDRELADTFIRISLEHNVIATRSHVAPWSDVWLDAADRNGLMVSLEGTWSWLMLVHIPSQRSLEIWKSELKALYRRHRNRPSLFLITMNNEMNFYLSRGTDEGLREKAYHVQGGLRVAREVFPDLPLVCDSGYYRAPTLAHSKDLNFPWCYGRYERVTLPNHYDDGDVDDPHFYYGWYDKDFFHFMNGEFGQRSIISGRPCLPQEMSVGYCRDEDGLAVRFYMYMHQTPQITTGQRAYEHCDPRYFQRNHAFQVKGLAETFRRVEHERMCGVILFAFETWFYHHYDPKRIQPMLSARRLKLAYQPILPSAELFGRHVWAGQRLNIRVSIIHDDRSRGALARPVLEAAVVADGVTLASTAVEYPDIPYFGVATMPVALDLPARLPAPCVRARLTLKVRVGDDVVGMNDDELVLAEALYGAGSPRPADAVILKGDAAAEGLCRRHRIPARSVDAVPAGQDGARLIVGRPLKPDEAAAVRAFCQAGGRAALLNQRDLTDELLEGKAAYTEDATEVVTMNAPENSLFAGIDERDTAWFDNGRDVPYVAYGRYSVDRLDPSVCALGETLQWHSYIGKPTDYSLHGGTPLFAARVGQGAMLVSSLRTDADARDPIACRLTDNILTWDFVF